MRKGGIETTMGSQERDREFGREWKRRREREVALGRYVCNYRRDYKRALLRNQAKKRNNASGFTSIYNIMERTEFLYSSIRSQQTVYSESNSLDVQKHLRHLFIIHLPLK